MIDYKKTLDRINTVEIHLPALRDRIGDIKLLAEHFLKMNIAKYRKNIKGISSTAIRKMEQYNWPGNVRELQHSVERAVILSESKILQPNDFMLKTPQNTGEEGNFGQYDENDMLFIKVRYDF